MRFEQLKTILWLRWRLTRNQWTRSRGLGAVVTALVAAAMISFGVLSFAGGFAGGMLGLRDAKPLAILGVWSGVTAGFLFFWVIGLVNEIQRSETIDLQRLMHLPIALGPVFLINYLASHLTMSIVLFVPGMIGLAGGLLVSKGPAMALLVPLSLAMVFMVSAWTYLLRGWLAALMTNPRRRRTVVVAITFGFIMISQLPNLFLNGLNNRGRSAPAGTTQEMPAQQATRRRTGQEKLDQVIFAAKFIPPFWLPVGAGALAEGRPVPALLGTLGCVALGALGLRRAYRSTVRFYQGDTGDKAAIPKPQAGQARPKARAKTGARFLELRIPAVPEQAAALGLATFRSMLRAPEVKMAWASSFFVTLIIAGTSVLRNPSHVPDAAKPFILTGAVVFSTFMLVQFYANQFGFDRDGFRSLVLSPAPRRLILLGKNLACLPAGGTFGVFVLGLISVWLRVPALVALATLLQLAALLMLAGLVGNLVSTLAPYRVQPGSMKPTKMPGLAMLLMVLCHLFFPIAMAPVFVPPLAELLWRAAGWPSAVPVNLLFSFGLAAIIGFVYWQSLGPMGRLLQRRETKILATVTVEVE